MIISCQAEEMLTFREKTIEVLAGMRDGILERDEAISLSLLSAMAGESIFLLGLPGVGKSMIARRLKRAFEGATVFEYLMSRFSTPDEIFGPVSISKLKDEDRYVRATTGFLPEAEVVFLDEIWKAGPAIQNSLLTVLNEKIYLNGNLEMKLPIKGIIGASNELPAKEEGLEALWDRFIIRVVVEPIENAANFKRLLTQSSDNENQSDVKLSFKSFSDDEYRRVRSLSNTVSLPDDIFDIILEIHDKLKRNTNAVDPETGEPLEENIKYYISDRRWKKCIGVLKTSAILNGRDKIEVSDLLLLPYMLWNDDSTIVETREMTAEAVISMLFKKSLDNFKSPKRHAKVKNSKTDFYSPDGFCYLIDCEDSPLKILKSDYEKIRKDSGGIFFGSETTEGDIIISNGGQFVIRFVKDGILNINGFNYPLKTNTDSELTSGFLDDTENAFDAVINKMNKDIQNNIFTCNSVIIRHLQSVAGLYRTRFMQLKR